jgi:hypothetical protein
MGKITVIRTPTPIKPIGMVTGLEMRVTRAPIRPLHWMTLMGMVYAITITAAMTQIQIR